MTRPPQIVRIVICAAIAAVALWVVYRFCWLRLACDRMAAQAQRRVMQAVRFPDAPNARIEARDVADRMAHCIEQWPTNIQFPMIRGAALRILGRPAEAALEYRRALAVDRRAEILLNLGLSELEAGRDEQASDALGTAAFLFYPYLDEIPEPMQSRVRADISPLFEKMNHGKASAAEAEAARQRVTRAPK